MCEVQIVLVEPSHPGNIGGAARAMKTMGLSKLVLVKPKRFPDPQADWRAAGALDVVESTVVFNTLEAALAPSVLTAATSARSRHIPWPVMNSAEFAEHVHKEYSSTDIVSVVFGREDSGLTNDELNLCNMQVQIPSSSNYGSLNLAMAVQVVAYDLFRVRSQASPTENAWDRPLATHQELGSFFAHLESVLTEIDFYDPENPREAMTRLRRLFSRTDLDQTEVQILRGILSHIEKATHKN
ncbi:MAG: RNA methyltransferase [Gammaproteobacteria bacterium]|nr:RNA methyltransferase [Gammaproteobacteria bacterium]MYD80097.1 RNA methyltransferase [Gammaproteobacteria bacterium]